MVCQTRLGTNVNHSDTVIHKTVKPKHVETMLLVSFSNFKMLSEHTLGWWTLVLAFFSFFFFLLAKAKYV